MKLAANAVEKPWGRTALPPPFAAPADGAPIGEIWFAAPGGEALPLLVKYIFTSQKLSVQVHPGDAQAHARGLPNGKNECWYIVDAEPGAVLGLGLIHQVDEAALRAAALDGSIERLLDWKPVKAGEFYSVPAGTIHAIGQGISLIEVQQPSDVTYRLYDYGRPRALHLEDAVAVAAREPYPEGSWKPAGGEDRVLLDGPSFTVRYVAPGAAEVEALAGRDRWVLPLSGTADAGENAGVGECLLVPAGAALTRSADAALLIASPA
jgi:mannose-6-phosphate isomerase